MNFRNPSEKPLTIHVSDPALMHLLWAGMESFHVRLWGGKPTDRRGPAETAGLLWGYYNERADMDHVIVEHVATDKYAIGTANSVDLNDRVVAEKQQVVRERWPHLSMVGDFHTHPYATYAEVQNAKGWRFSPDDIGYYESRSTGEWHGRIALVLTITELERYAPEKAVSPAPSRLGSIIRWQVGRYRFWLSSCAIDILEGSNSFVVSRGGDAGIRPAVYLDVPTVNGTDAWFSYSEFE